MMQARGPNGVHGALLDVLQRHLSPIIAQSVLTRALREHQLKPASLTVSDLRVLAPRLETAARLFVDPKELEPLRRGLRDLAGDAPRPEALVRDIQNEKDLAALLIDTRQLCQQLRLRPMSLQRIATIVSELGRNIVSYTSGGTVEVTPVDVPRLKVCIRARDSGNGIPNLEEIFAGRYRSKTGLGRGLLGVKRLADRFDIRSDHSGTVVEVELDL